MRFLLAAFAALLFRVRLVMSLVPHPIKSWTTEISVGYDRRVAADSSFPVKSIVEVFLAASTQFAAEWKNRGAPNMLPQIDFIFPAILTAVAGKYMSMWKTAKT